MRRFLNAKIHRATVTETALHYEGSLGIDRALMDAAGIAEFEQVEVANVNTGERLTTYAIPAASGEIILNGAAARKGSVGDLLIIMTYVDIDPAAVAGHRPRVVAVDERNRPRAL